MTAARDIREVLDRLDEEEVPHMLVGALALDALGTSRRTADVDILADTNPPRKGASRYMGLVLEERSRDEVFDQPVVAGHLPTRPTPFELFFATHPYTRETLDRRQTVEVESIPGTVPVPSVEDFLVMKAAYRAHPSRSRRKGVQDDVDLESVVETQGETIDWEAVEERARRVGCWDVLADLEPG